MVWVKRDDARCYLCDEEGVGRGVEKGREGAGNEEHKSTRRNKKERGKIEERNRKGETGTRNQSNG